jgi:hypothetical protein
MRVAKLSTEEFADESRLDEFFAALSQRNPPGLFLIGKQIAADGLTPGETVLFTYRGRLRYVAHAASGRLDNTFARQGEYPFCFILDPPSVQRGDASLAELEQALNAAGAEVSLAGQGWTRVPDSPATERAFAAMVSGAVGTV